MDFEVELISFERQPHWQNEEPDKKIRHAGKAGPLICKSWLRLPQPGLHRVSACQHRALESACMIWADCCATFLRGQIVQHKQALCTCDCNTLCNSHLQCSSDQPCDAQGAKGTEESRLCVLCPAA